MRETSSRVVVGRKEGWRGAVSARASGFPKFRMECEVESRGGRSRAFVATRDTTRRTPSRPFDRPDRASAIERLKARVREPENADGGGSHASVYAGGLRVTHPRLCPCLCRSDLRRRPCRTRQPLSGPSSPPWSSPRRPSRASRRLARGRREKKVSPCCSARRMRGGREGTATTTPTRSLENRVASTRRRVPGCVYRARGRSRTRTERGGA